MRRHSSGSSEDGDSSPVEAPHVSHSSFRTKETRAAAPSTGKLDRRSVDQRPSFSINRRSSSINWRPPDSRNGTVEDPPSPSRTAPSHPLGLFLAANGELQTKEMAKTQESRFAGPGRRSQWPNPWSISILALVTSVVGIGFLLAVLHSSVTRQIDPKGCRMSYMRPSYARFDEFDTEHTRLASKYSLYLYREQGIDHDTKV